MNAEDRQLFQRALDVLGANRAPAVSGAELIKSMPDDDAVLEAWAESLTEEQAQALVEQVDQQQTLERLDQLEQRIDQATPAIIARRTAAARLGALAKSSGSPEEQLAAMVRREEIRERQERVLAREQPRHATSWMFHENKATPEQVADAVMALGAADRQAAKPRWAM